MLTVSEQNSNVFTDVISGAGHVHCFGTVTRMPLVEQNMFTVSEQ